MSLRRKTISAIIVTMASLIVILYAVSRFILLASFGRLKNLIPVSTHNAPWQPHVYPGECLAGAPYHTAQASRPTPSTCQALIEVAHEESKLVDEQSA